MQYKVMIVDDNISNLIMAQKTLEEEYEVLPVSSGLSALECLADMPDLPDLVVLDIDMPNVNGFQVISEMKNSRRLRNIPAIFLTAQDDTTTELESYNLGAVDYIRKPYTASLLKKRINVQIQLLEQKRKLEETNALLTTVIQGQRKKDVMEQNALAEMLVNLIGKRNMVFALHARRTGKYMEIFMQAIAESEKYDLDESKVKCMIIASQLHDLGKICLKDVYMSENGTGNKNYDKDIADMHTVIGSDILRKLSPKEELETPFVTYAYNMSRSHHEKYDGTGFPDKLSGDKIPLEARIVAIVNAYDCYKVNKKLEHSEACKRLNILKGKYFDSELVEIFMSKKQEIAEATI